jgi:hypothetical protein
MLARAVEFLRFMEVRQSIGEKRWPYVPHVAVVVRVQSFVCNISPEGYGVVLEPKETSRVWSALYEHVFIVCLE